VSPRRRAPAVVLALVLLAAAACAKGEADHVLTDTAANLSRLRSGVIGLPNAPATLAGARAGQVEQAVRASSVTLTTGVTDCQLRTLHLAVDLDPAGAGRLRPVPGSLARPHVTLDLAIGRPVRPVRVKEPRALPVPIGG
jgi:hypothetical protein